MLWLATHAQARLPLQQRVQRERAACAAAAWDVSRPQKLLCYVLQTMYSALHMKPIYLLKKVVLKRKEGCTWSRWHICRQQSNEL